MKLTFDASSYDSAADRRRGALGWTGFEKAMGQASPLLDRTDVEPTKASDPFVIYFTSGTTKYPKMVHHVCSYPLGHLRTAGLWHSLTDKDLIWVVSDTGWAKSAWGSTASGSREIEFMDELPKTVSGKVKRAVLRTRELGKGLGVGKI